MRRALRVTLTVVPVGLVTGWLSVGVLGRLAMMLLARLNPAATGVTSDDGFEMGTFTLAGTANLMFAAGTFLGLLSAVLYLLLRPLMTGPGWFRLLSVSLGAGVVVASQVVHPDGVDFTLLRPLWLAVGLFVLIPTLHVAVVSAVSERLLSDDPRRWRELPGWLGWPARGALAVLFVLALIDLVRDVAVLG
ncbi:hypothetical protein GCM10009623_00780 [Nocardioides aestuarii]|uniref:DUF998 domain-containing protein n=1 Tax=Nocardioides aestuarii TaxID=252231 RepID=A0ABW4TH66_9ACTN